MIREIEEYEQQYDADISAGKESEWEKWGGNKRQRCMNRRSYDKYKECGFTDEPIFDSYGWFQNDRTLEAQETITLWLSENHKNAVECLQLPNGKWISGIHYMLSESGCFHGLSVWNKQYDSRVKALSSPILPLLNRLRKSSRQKDREHVTDIVKALDNIKQLTLF